MCFCLIQIIDPFILYHCNSNVCKFYLFYSYLFIYFIQGRSENHFCENAPCIKIIIIIIIIIIIGQCSTCPRTVDFLIQAYFCAVYDYARKADQARDIEIQNENWG